MGARRADVCTHCSTFHAKVVPDFKQFLQKARADLEAIPPSCFNVLDEYGGLQEDAEKEIGPRWPEHGFDVCMGKMSSSERNAQA